MPRPVLRTLLAGLLWVGATRPSPAFGADAPGLDGYRTPKGWGVSVAAAEPLVVNPVTMTFGDDGRLYVVEWKAGREPNDRIMVLTDDDGDGRFDRSDVFMDGLDLPAGVLFFDGWLYLTLEHDLVRLRDADKDGRFETRQVIVSGFGNDNSHHRVSGISLGPDGWIYLTTGDSDAHPVGSDGSRADVLRCGGVFRCRPDGSRVENVALGMRNPWGNIAFDDAFRAVHTDNDNEGSPGFTGCRLLHVVEGGDYGWRLREGARCCNPDFDRATWNGGRPGRLGWMSETGRGAPAGLCVLNSPAFPPPVKNLLVYPDVFRKSVRAYPMKPAGATFQTPDEIELLASDEGLFRPTDAEVGPDGALYILDWRTDSGGAGQLSGNGTTGRIYRMTWTGTAADPAIKTLARDRFVALRAASTETLVGNLASPDHELRVASGKSLMTRKSDPTLTGLLSKTLGDPSTPPTARLHALGVFWSVAAGSAEFDASLERSLSDSDPAVRRFGFDLLGRRPAADDARDRRLAALALAAAGGPSGLDPEVRRAAFVALGRFGGLKGPDGPAADRIASTLIQAAVATSAADPFLRDGVTRGLERLGPAGLDALVRAVGSKNAAESAAALHVLQGWRSVEGLDAVLAAATSADPLPAETRTGLFRTLRELAPAVSPEPVAAWLAANPKAPAGPRARAVALLAALGERSALAAGPLLDRLLADPDAEVRASALNLAREVRTPQAREALAALVASDARPSGERSAALSALRAYRGYDPTPVVLDLFPKSTDAGFRLELLRALASKDLSAAARLARGLLGESDRPLRQEAISILGSRPDTALDLARRFEEGKLPPEDLSRVIDAIRPYATPEIQAVTQALVKKTVLLKPGSDEARRFREFVGRSGSPGRGKALYLDPKKGGCAVCHRLEGEGGAVGPDLTRVWETLSFEKRIESILEPSKEIKEGFGTYSVATVDGRVLNGLLVSETAEGVTLKDANGREIRVPAKEIDQKATSPVSLMPAGVVGHLSLNEFADLLAFLGDRPAQESLRKGAATPPPGR